MPVSNQIRITRDKLAQFVPDHDTIIQLEKLIALINSLDIPVGGETLEEIIQRVHDASP